MNRGFTRDARLATLRFAGVALLAVTIVLAGIHAMALDAAADAPAYVHYQ